MMTLDEIRRATINPVIAKEAYDQAAQRLADALDTKKAFEQKAFALFGGYLTISLALFGAGAAVFQKPEMRHLVGPFWSAGSMFVLGTIFFLLALMDKGYGSPASDPEMWLNPGTIDGPDTVLPTMLAYITYYHRDRIDTSVAMNNTKAQWIRLGVYSGIGAVPLFVLLVLV